MQVPSLYQFFRRQVRRGFSSTGIEDLPVIEYVSDLLTRFTHTHQLYPFTGHNGETLEHIIDFTLEVRRAQGWEDQTPNRSRELMITRHIGEYTLFMTGLFRERLEARQELDYYFSHGRSAYWQCADIDYNPTRKHLFRKLATDFPMIANILTSIRQIQLPLSTQHQLSPLSAYWHK